MKRLTRKIKGANNYCEFELKDQPYKSFLDIKRNSDLEWLDVCDLTLAIDKLGQLEDLEEELGIDLITLFKALKEGVWFSFKNMKTESFSVKYKNKKHHIIPKLKFYNGGDKINWYLEINHEDWDYCYHLYPEDYGKTWWLEKPKEELEND